MEEVEQKLNEIADALMIIDSKINAIFSMLLFITKKLKICYEQNYCFEDSKNTKIKVNKISYFRASNSETCEQFYLLVYIFCFFLLTHFFCY